MSLIASAGTLEINGNIFEIADLNIIATSGIQGSAAAREFRESALYRVASFDTNFNPAQAMADLNSLFGESDDKNLAKVHLKEIISDVIKEKLNREVIFLEE